MGKKSLYFRHSLTAHQDNKIIEVIEIGGIKCIGVYFVLIELYGTALRDDDNSNISQKISERSLANAVGLRVDACRKIVKLLVKVGLIEVCFGSVAPKFYQVSIPKFLKYYGRYDVLQSVKSPYKRKEKEKKEKENKTKQNKLNKSKEVFNSDGQEVSISNSMRVLSDVLENFDN